MRNRKVLLGGLACLLANTMLMSTAHADRRTGLSGNLLIQDADDVFPFPQHAVTYRNMIRLDYGPGAGPNAAVGSSGNGVMTLGDENSAYGVALHRGDLLSPDVVGQSQELQWLGGVGNPFGASSYGTFATPATPATGAAAGTALPATVFDLFYARKMGDNLFGLRLGFARGVQSVTNDGDTAKGAQSVIAAQVGYSILPPDGLRLDLAANLVFALGKSTNLAGDDVNSGMNIRLGALARGYYPINPVLDVGFLGNLSVENESSSQDTPKDSSNVLNVGLMGGVGPAIKLERAKVAAYGGLVLGFGQDEPSDETDDDEISTISFAAPMVNMAVEVQLLDWLYARTGAQYTWGLTRAGYKNGAGDDASDKVAASTFGWTAGLGVTKDNFSFDGVVTNGFVTGGPNFIGGTAPGFLAMASATYRFGDVFSGAGTAPQEAGTVEEQTPPPPPAPVEPPPPPQEIEAVPAADGSATGTTTSTDTSIGIGGSASGSIGKP